MKKFLLSSPVKSRVVDESSDGVKIYCDKDQETQYCLIKLYLLRIVTRL